MHVVWITGASSGIGAAVLQAAPSGAHVTGISRRANAAPRALRLDLADPGAWETIIADIKTGLAGEGVSRATFIHLAGDTGPLASAVDQNTEQVIAAVMLNTVSSLALGQAFLQACSQRSIPGTLVLSSSPAASAVLPGMAGYCASKAAVEKWVEVVASETADSGLLRAIAVVPHAVDTPMVRAVMGSETEDVALRDYFVDLEATGELSTAKEAAAHLWSAVDDPRSGPIVAIGARHLAPPREP